MNTANAYIGGIRKLDNCPDWLNRTCSRSAVCVRVCLAVRCPEMSVPAGTSRNTSASTYLTYAHYTCNGDTRMLDGSTYRTVLCDAAAQWSDVVTDCQRMIISIHQPYEFVIIKLQHALMCNLRYKQQKIYAMYN